MKLQVRLFGTYEILLDDQPAPALRTGKVRALLAYLLLEAHRPHTREALAGLLWPDQPADAGLHNLRQALSTLRKALGDDPADPSSTFLLIENDTIQWNAAVRAEVDALEFSRQLNASHPNGRTNIRRLQRALELYRAPFLAHFSLPDSSNWEEWQILTREMYNRQAVDVLDTLTIYHERRHEFDQAARLAERVLKLAPWDENLHAACMRLLALQGKWSAALAQYAACRRYLKDELDVEPTPATTALFEQIRQAGASGKQPPPRFPPARHNLPLPSTPFSGRARELDDLAEQLANPQCRLLTLLGPGGIGKTRLAIEAAREQIGVFADGVFFIPLNTVTRCDQLPVAIAEGIGINLLPREDPQTQLCHALSAKSMLLVLDTMEQLASGALCLSEILSCSPHLVLLATSQARLNLQEEWVYRVEGMQVPQEGCSNPDELLRCNAAEFFVNTARRVGYSTPLDESSCRAVSQICRLVEGTPLSLELAASACRVRTFAEIAADLSHGIDTLATELINVPARHRSLRATFEHAWALLTPAEQQGFARLGIFHGRFSQEAALEITGMPASIFDGLVEKFLVKRNDHRFWLHDSVRRFALEKLSGSPVEQEQLAAQHSQYYAAYVQQRESLLESLRQEQALEELTAALENITAAWRHAAARQVTASLAQSLNGLHLYFDLRSRYREGIELFEGAASQLAEAGSLRASILARQGILHNRLGHQETSLQLLQSAWQSLQLSSQVDEQTLCLIWMANITRKAKKQSEARRYVDQALAIARQHQLKRAISSALYIHGIIEYNAGEFEKASIDLDESLQIARELNNPRLIMAPLNSLADIHCAGGEMEPALKIYEECLHISQQLRDRYNEAMYDNNLGTVYHYLEQYERAAELYQQSMTICRDIGDENGVSIALSNLGELALLAEDYSRAESYFVEGLTIARKTADIWSILANLNNLGLALIHLGQMEKARLTLLDGLFQAQQAEIWPRALQSLVLLSLWLEKASQPARACQLARAALADPALEDGLRPMAEAVIERSGNLNGKPVSPASLVIQQILTDGLG